MERRDHYRARVSMALEDVFVGRAAPDAYGLSSGLGGTKYEKLVAVLGIVKACMPECVNERISRSLGYDTSGLPYSPREYSLRGKIGQGGFNKVYLLESLVEGNPSFTLKLSWFIRGDSKALLNEARHQRDEYEELRSAFGKKIVPEENFFIAVGIRKEGPVMSSLQLFQTGPIRDIFVGLNREELIQKLTHNQRLLGQVSKFVDDVASQGFVEKEIDLLGKDNLVVVGEEGKEALLLLDPHFRIPHSGDNREDEIRTRVDYLAQIAHEAMSTFTEGPMVVTR